MSHPRGAKLEILQKSGYRFGVAFKAPRSACFQPDNYRDLDLFADREDKLDALTATLMSFLDLEGPGEGRVLVRGHRGVGKSMLVRRAVQGVLEKLHVLHVQIDCAHIERDSTDLLRNVTRRLGKETLEHALDENLRREAELMTRLAEVSTVEVKEVSKWSTELKLGAGSTFKLEDYLRFELGLARVTGRSREVTEKSERNIDLKFLEEMMSAFLSDCRRARHPVLLVIDNLDQIGYAEIEEDVKRVTDLARILFGLRDCLIIATIRTEFVSQDLHKLHSQEELVEGMKPEELLAVARKRMASASAPRKEALEEARFEEVATRLATLTNNAWGYLIWLANLDYSNVDGDQLDLNRLKDALLPRAVQQHAGIREHELKTIAEAYRGTFDDYRHASDLEAQGITIELRERALKYGALIPDWLLSPERFKLSPKLHFLVPSPSG